MSDQIQDEFRPANDSRKRPALSEKEKPMKTVESKPSLGQRWKSLQPTKAHLIWACLATMQPAPSADGGCEHAPLQNQRA